MDFDYPQIALPLQILDSGDITLVETDTEAEIQLSVFCCLAYELGQLTVLPTFGLPDQAFVEGGANLAQIEAVVTKWEPRARELIRSDPNWMENAIQTILLRRDDPNG